MNPSMPKARTLGMKSIHHQIGALSSTSDATRLEIQPKPRRFATNGWRCSSGGGSGAFTGPKCAGLACVTPTAISQLLPCPNQVGDAYCRHREGTADVVNFGFRSFGFLSVLGTSALALSFAFKRILILLLILLQTQRSFGHVIR